MDFIKKIEGNLLEINSFIYRRNGEDILFNKDDGKILLKNNCLNFVYIDTLDNFLKSSVNGYPENSVKIGKFNVYNGNVTDFILEFVSISSNDDEGKMWYQYSFYPTESAQSEAYLYYNNFSSEEYGAPIPKKSILKKAVITVKTPIEVDLIIRKCDDLLTDVVTFALTDDRRFFVFKDLDVEFEEGDEICAWIGLGTGETISESINVTLFFLED